MLERLLLLLLCKIVAVAGVACDVVPLVVTLLMLLWARLMELAVSPSSPRENLGLPTVTLRFVVVVAAAGAAVRLGVKEEDEGGGDEADADIKDGRSLALMRWLFTVLLLIFRGVAGVLLF